MSITAAVYEDHVAMRLDRAEEKLDDLLLSSDAKDQFSHDGSIFISVDLLGLSPREVMMLMERYRHSWHCTQPGTKLRFVPLIKEVQRSALDPSPREVKMRGSLMEALDVIRELITIHPGGASTIRAEALLAKHSK